MFSRNPGRAFSGPRLLVAALALACLPTLGLGGNNNGNFFNQRQIGGVLVNAEGVLANVESDDKLELRKLRLEAMQPISDDVNQKTDLRMVSLRRLEQALQEHAKTLKPLPDEMRYLAGLQRVQYVFVYPEQQDIVLAGPGEGWKIDGDGNVVGETTGLPVMHLDDLLVGSPGTELEFAL